jgi:hypothetical protein
MAFGNCMDTAIPFLAIGLHSSLLVLPANQMATGLPNGKNAQKAQSDCPTGLFGDLPVQPPLQNISVSALTQIGA